MIRRDADGCWLLISQVEHARLAAEIAAAWGGHAATSLPVPAQLVPAIHNHDAGWSGWEAAPTVDPKTGKPRDFMEMPMSEATAIWSRSILPCSARSPLGGLWVSKHFVWLAESARENRNDARKEVSAIHAFLAEQAALQAQLHEEAGAQYTDEKLAALIDDGFRYVQFFDRISLWLCSAERTERWGIECAAGAGARYRFLPQTPALLTIEPFPLSRERLELTVPARRIAATRFATDAELRAALRDAPVEQLRWTLRSSKAAS